jgi:hypothetical protein
MSWGEFFGKSFFYPEGLPDLVCVVNCWGDPAFSRAHIILCLLAGMLIARKWWAIPIATALAIVAGKVLYAAFEVSTTQFECLDYNIECQTLPEPGFFYRFVGELYSDFRHFPPGAEVIGTGLVVATLGYAVVRGWSAINGPATSQPVRWATATSVVLFALVGAAFLGVRSSPELLPRSVLDPASRLTGNAPPICAADPKAIIKDLYEEPEIQQRAKPATTGKVVDTPVSPLPEIHSTWLTFEHQISRHIPIRVSNPEKCGPHRAIALEVIIDEAGRVIEAAPKSGPTDLHPQAVNLARDWKFIPFTRNGRPVAVKFVRAKVSIDGPARKVRKSGVPTLLDRSRLLVRYQNLQQDGAFDLWIRGDGSVSFIGKEGTALPGLHCATLSDAAIDTVIRAVSATGAFAMLDNYSSRNAGFQLDIAFGDTTKTVMVLQREEGDDMPRELWSLVDTILKAASVKRWWLGDRFTAPSLIAERWNFAEKSDANTWMASRVARFGDDQALKDLIALGAPLPGAPEAVPGDGPLAVLYASTRETGIEGAASAASPSKLKMLLATQTRWSPEAVENAYVNALATDADDVIELLEQMRIGNAKTSTSEKSALMAAAESGYPDRVATQLARGGSVKDTGMNDMTALHWAAGMEYPRLVPSARVDRRAVVGSLVRAGANVNARDRDGNTPLNVNWMGIPEVTAALVSAGADVNTQNDDGETPLMTNKSLKAVQLLLKAGADPRVPNQRGESALDVARSDVHAQSIADEIERWMRAHPKQN